MMTDASHILKEIIKWSLNTNGENFLRINAFDDFDLSFARNITTSETT